MKQFIWEHLFKLLAIILAMISVIYFAIEGSWYTAGWAGIAGMGGMSFLLLSLRFARLKKEFEEYVNKVEGAVK